MGRKRSKPVADHIETAPEQGNTTPADQESPPTEQSVPAEPDVFDRAIAAGAAGQFEPRPEQTNPGVPDTAARIDIAMAAAPVVRASTLEAPEAAQSQDDAAPRVPLLPKVSDRLLDPRSIEMISLDSSNDGPKMRLLRSQRHRDVWIQFDKNPGKEITDQIKAEGFRWEPRAEAGNRNGAWVKPLEQGREIRIMLDAERLFLNLGNQIRQSNGLEPVGKVGVGAG